jgi:hypothetical protein
LKDKVENMDIGLSSLRELVVPKTPLGGIKRLHKIGTSNFNKELVSLMNLDLLPFNLSLVIVTPSSWGWQEVKKKKGKNVGLRIIF